MSGTLPRTAAREVRLGRELDERLPWRAAALAIFMMSLLSWVAVGALVAPLLG